MNDEELKDVREIWKATFELGGRKDTVFLLADDCTAALAKALDYRSRYEEIADQYPLTHLELISESFI